jgi:hypothetical protein
MSRVGGLDPISHPLSLMVIRLLSICRLVLSVLLLLLGLRVGSVLGKLSLVLVVVVAVGVASKLLVTSTPVTPVVSSSAASTTSEVVAAIVIEVTVITLIVSCLES